jgi:Xaa-Pro aminopeptidase
MTTGTVVPTYSLTERDRRWSLARTFLQSEGLDALIVFGEHEDAGSAPHYLDTWFTNDRPGATVLFPRDGEMIVIASFGGEDGWVSQEQTRLDRWATTHVDAINELGLAKGTIGIVGLERYGPWHHEGVVPYRLWNTILTEFPTAEFRSVDKAFQRLIAPLSDEEIEVVRYSASIGDAMAEAMVDASGPGVPENEVYAAAMAVAHARGTTVPVMLLGSGPLPRTGCPPQWTFRPQAPRVLESGDVIRAEVFCTFGMRSTQHQVTIAIGDVHEDWERGASVARESYDVGLKALRSKRTFGEVVEEMRKPVEEAGGLAAGTRLGQPLIHSLNPFGLRGGGLPTKNGDMELRPGMTFAVEPYCVFGPRKIVIGGTAIVGDEGAIELNPYTAQLLRSAS